MSKAGDNYRELVGSLMSALDAGAVVKTEQWIEGPDGERDLDVEVRGTVAQAPHFILVECKDHARPIGIGFIDAFESKIGDLKPNRAIMFSNSGFTSWPLFLEFASTSSVSRSVAEHAGCVVPDVKPAAWARGLSVRLPKSDYMMATQPSESGKPGELPG